MPARLKNPARVTALTAAAAALAAVAAAPAAAAAIPQTTCFWTNRGASKFDTDPAKNYAFPDTGAVYWSAKVTMPPGSKIVLRGKFAHARYQSLNSYDGATNAPTDALNDVSTKPDAGSTNPFLPGARRDAAKRSYTATLLNEPAPAVRARNTLYAGVAGQAAQQIIYRVYVPDSFARAELTGGVGLPKPELHLADGSVLTGQAACTALQAQRGPLGLTRLSPALYASLRGQPGKPATFPADPVPTFRAFYNIGFSIACSYQGACGGSPNRIGGQYSNIDNQYVSAYVSRGFPKGPVLVLRGKLPTTPATGSGVKRMGRGQLRYWSICQNESLFTTRGAGCVFDSEIPLGKGRTYTIVTSARADRPRNATAKCGVAYLPWPAAGDGAGHPKDGLLIVRNMLPASSFGQAIQRTATPGDEARVMGPYLPRGTYTTKAAFEKRGC
ncbi:MAG: hypothetical protein U0R70_12435 [Solirubrobacteraceae bacterium]